MKDLIERGQWRGRPPFESMARPDLLDQYRIMDRLIAQSGAFKAVTGYGLDISFPSFDTEGNTSAPDEHLVLVLDELWLLWDSFRLRDPSVLISHPCCDRTDRLISTPARCETMPFCDGCA